MTQAGSVVTLVTITAHGWGAASDTVAVKFAGAESSGFPPLGNLTATVVDANTATVPWASVMGPIAIYGYVIPQITSISWVANVVTVTYGAPHRLPIGVPITQIVAGTSAGTGSRVCTATSTTELTFPLTGSGTITGAATATIQPSPTFSVTSVPSAVLADGQSRLSEYYPVVNGVGWWNVITAKAATTLTVGLNLSLYPFQEAIPSGTEIRIGSYFSQKGTILLARRYLLWIFRLLS
jgi:hypothetical protein